MRTRQGSRKSVKRGCQGRGESQLSTDAALDQFSPNARIRRLSFTQYDNFAERRLERESLWNPTTDAGKILIPVADGSRLDAFVSLPTAPGRGPFGAVVMVHGFASEKRENGLFQKLSASLNKRGYLVVMYDWRGLGQSEGTFSTTLEEHSRDFRDVVQWLSTRYSLSPSNICALGFSLGCGLIGLEMKKGLKVGGAIYLSPAVRPRFDMWPRYSSLLQRIELFIKGKIAKPGTGLTLGREIVHSLRDTDLGKEAFDLGVPLLVCHGTADQRIPIKTSRVCFDNAGTAPVYFREFTGATHSFRPNKAHRNHLCSLVNRWLSSEELRNQHLHDWDPVH